MNHKFKIDFKVPKNIDGSENKQFLEVFFGKIKDTGREGRQEITFKTTIPTKIYNFLKGKKCVLGGSSKIEMDFTEKAYGKFTKTVSAQSLDNLTGYMFKVFAAFTILKNIQSADAQKVIYIFHESEYGEKKSYWNGSPMGLSQLSTMNYMVAYKTTLSQGFSSNIILSVDKSVINKLQEKEFFENAVCIDWTEQRENQVKLLYDKLLFANDSIGKFIKGLNNENFEKNITNSTKLLN